MRRDSRPEGGEGGRRGGGREDRARRGRRRSAAGGVIKETSQKVLESTVDDLLRRVLAEAKNRAAAAAEDERKAEATKNNRPDGEEATAEVKDMEEKKVADEGESPAESAEAVWQKRIRHQLIQRIKMASQAGMSPDEFTERFMVQIRINHQKRKEEDAQKLKARRAASKGETSHDDDDDHDDDIGTDEESGRKAKKAKTSKSAKKELTDKKKTPTKKQSKGPNKTKKVLWTDEEVAKLREARKKFGRNWVAVADHVGTRNNRQCKSRNQKMETMER